MQWALRGNGWEVSKALLILVGALGATVFLNPSLVLGRVPGLKELDAARQVALIRPGAAIVAVLGFLSAAAIFYGAN
jgi:hypothetical protein